MLGERLKDTRIKNNLTQREVADKIGVQRGTYAHYEIGRRIPSLEIMGRLASLFGVTIDYLWGEKKNELLDTLQTNKEQTPNQGEIEELTRGLDEESMEELHKFIKYLYTRQTLSPDNDESSAGLDGGETGKK